MRKTLTAKQEAFCVEYLRLLAEGKSHGAASLAYVHAYDASRMTKESVNRTAMKLFKNALIASRIEKARDEINKKINFGIAEILDQWVQIANADANDLVQLQKNCCRHCYGVGHAYQWQEFEFALESAKHMQLGKIAPQNLGGFGFNPTLAPNETCPNCFGEGVEKIFHADTRKLKGGTRLLYNGIKQTRNGPEILLRDRDLALQNIAKFLGMDKNSDNANSQKEKLGINTISEITKDPIEAANIYIQVMRGS